MSLSRQIQLIIGAITLLAMTVLGGYTYSSTKSDIYSQLLRESDAVYNFLMAVRRVGQKQFVYSGIPLTEKTVGFLPAHSLPRVSDEFSANWDKRGIQIKTSSDRPRNPRNQANQNELEAMKLFRNDDEQEIFTKIDKENFFYARPVWVVKSCLKCHGERASAPPTISGAYDAAYGYEVGELRGVVSITTPITALNEEILPRLLPKVALILLFGLLSALSINYFLQRFLRQKEVAETGLNRAKEEAERANMAKDEFLAAMSHELRTPLTSIIGNSELLAEQEEDKQKKNIIFSIEVAGRNQLALVDEILDISNIESGDFAIEESPFDLSMLLKNVEHVLAIYAQGKGIELIIEQKSDERYLLLGDTQRTGQILINLVSNAIKFTETGRVTLTTEVDQQRLLYKVEDTGIGMAPGVVEKLFHMFQQADGSTSRRFGGSGLGLFISLNLAKLMGGTIEVSSQEGVGSIFTLILPYRRSDIPIHAPVLPKESQSAADKKLSGHILVAEDTPELQLLERRILERMGLDVTVASNGKEAVDLTDSQPFDLVLMDIQMPVMDGIEACKIIKSKGNKVPIIALTANVLKRHRDQFDEAGCDGFLSKPIDKQELRHMISKFLKQNSTTTG